MVARVGGAASLDQANKGCPRLTISIMDAYFFQTALGWMSWYGEKVCPHCMGVISSFIHSQLDIFSMSQHKIKKSVKNSALPLIIFPYPTQIPFFASKKKTRRDAEKYILRIVMICLGETDAQSQTPNLSITLPSPIAKARGKHSTTSLIEGALLKQEGLFSLDPVIRFFPRSD